VLLALRCFHSICENCEALPLRKTLLRCCNHALAHLAAACACARCITRVAQLIICFRVHGQRTRRHSWRTRAVAVSRHTLIYPTWRNCAIVPRERSPSSRAGTLSTP